MLIADQAFDFSAFETTYGHSTSALNNILSKRFLRMRTFTWTSVSYKCVYDERQHIILFVFQLQRTIVNEANTDCPINSRNVAPINEYKHEINLVPG